MVAALRFTAALFGAVATFAAAADEYFEGDGTSYTIGQVSSGNCNFMSAIPSASNNYVALNQAQWDNLGNCGRCIEVSCIDEQCTVKNKTAVVQVLDRCPECAHGALDLSPTVYKEITGLDPNRLTVRWRFVDCPDPGTLQVCLMGGSNPNWVAVQPTNGVVGVKSVTVNGGATTMLDGAYYYVSTTSNTDLSAVKVAVTSIKGDVISGSYSLTAGKCTDTNKQFASSSGGDTSQQQSPATAATPTTTAPTQTYGSNNGDQSSSDGTNQSSQSDGTNQYDQSSQANGSTENDASSAATTTASIESTPKSTPATQESTSETPASETTNAPTQSGDTTKCKVRTRRQRN
ncbi:RxLR-like protein [Phytophthora cinnamomi]|uniref:RxLR-like protein n=1 Tax=Phytophthora cinnamomi TaxID=4785 RepID=UPI00355A8368|nr:RxLR-like protein [Phytophthora cinnamomi]